jgi:hypothetical protein
MPLPRNGTNTGCPILAIDVKNNGLSVDFMPPTDFFAHLFLTLLEKSKKVLAFSVELAYNKSVMLRQPV